MPIDSNTIINYTKITFGIGFAKDNSNTATTRKN